MAPLFIGSSLKMYFTHTRTLEWTAQVAAACATHPAVTSGHVVPFVIPSFPTLPEVRDLAAPGRMLLGAQDTHWEDFGAFTGEVSPVELAEIGVSLVEVGHAERRSIFKEDESIVAAKVAAIVRNGMTPLLCVGEAAQGDSSAAVDECLAQVRSALSEVPAEATGRLVVAYEPIWAIGAPAPAGDDHIKAVCQGLKDGLADQDRFEVTVIYGGSAGPGLLPRITPEADGMFLGRFAHDPQAFKAILDEAWELAQR